VHKTTDEMKVAIMQPYFVPYIGYYQLIRFVDLFVVYDNIEYTKKGWFARNRILKNGEAELIGLTIAKGPDNAHVVDRYLADTFHSKDKIKLKNKIQEQYRKAPFFNETMPVINDILACDANNLFEFIFNSLKITTGHLGITTPMVRSSEIAIDHSLRSENKVLAICEALGAKQYVNPIGGVDLYSRERFQQKDIELSFLKANNIEYSQAGDPFIPFLSIIDVMMYNSLDKITDYLTQEFTIQ
jgi:hypothetical protein